MKTLIIGTQNLSTSQYYVKLGIPPSILIESDKVDYSVGHTSPADVTVDILEKLMLSADQIYWAENAVEEFSNTTEYYNFLNWLKDFNLQHKKILNLDIELDPFNWNHKTQLTEKDIVFLGCSFTAGEGLSDSATHYSSIVADHYGLNPVVLAENGASNSLMFDKFVQLDFKPGQIVILQLTSMERLHYCREDKKLSKIMFATPKFKDLSRNFLEVYNRDFLFYELLGRIRAIVSIARLKKIKLIIWAIDRYYSLEQLSYFYNIKEFMPASWIFDYQVDLAEDNAHPGIESNRNIANTLIKYIENVYEI